VLNWRLLMLLLAAGPALAQPASVVLGQSLPMTGAGFTTANRVRAGALLAVERANAGGGVLGRPVELLTLDDGGDARRLADNVRRLREQGALALLNCVGEQACHAATQASAQAGLPLVGPLSGDARLRAPALRHVFTLRPDDAREAQLLAGQLRVLSVGRVALLADGHEPVREAQLARALQAAGLTVLRVAVKPQQPLAGLAELAGNAGAAVLSLGPDSLQALSETAPAYVPGLPSLLMTAPSAGLTEQMRLLRGHGLGFTTVLPNPEASQLPLVRDFGRDAERFGAPDAVTFEGLAGYLHTLLCIEALRRGRSADTPVDLVRALQAWGRRPLGGFDLVFTPDQHHGSTFAELGVRSRDGMARR
jgi:branched-chain amino acid transport system substrate-binding protein